MRISRKASRVLRVKKDSRWDLEKCGIASRGKGTQAQATGMKKRSNLELSLQSQLEASGIKFVTEAMVIPGRRFRVDFLIDRLVVECEGGIWIKGGHSTGKGITRDIEKGNLLTLNGFCVLRFTKDMINNGTALKQIKQFIHSKIER
jgi:very-short-patch-repair endonuclease